MLKQDLKDGMILKIRNGNRYLLIDGRLLNDDGFLRLESYSKDLKNKLNKGYDIVKVYKNNEIYSLKSIFKDDYLTLIWERKEIKLTDIEVELLKALKVLGYTYITRDEDGELYAYEKKPKKHNKEWWNVYTYYRIKKDENIFNFIQWEDKEPTNIDDLQRVQRTYGRN